MPCVSFRNSYIGYNSRLDEENNQSAQRSVAVTRAIRRSLAALCAEMGYRITNDIGIYIMFLEILYSVGSQTKLLQHCSVLSWLVVSARLEKSEFSSY